MLTILILLQVLIMYVQKMEVLKLKILYQKSFLKRMKTAKSTLRETLMI